MSFSTSAKAKSLMHLTLSGKLQGNLELGFPLLLHSISSIKLLNKVFNYQAKTI